MKKNGKALLAVAACMLLCMVAGAFTGCQTQENAAPQQEGAAPAEQAQSHDPAGVNAEQDGESAETGTPESQEASATAPEGAAAPAGTFVADGGLFAVGKVLIRFDKGVAYNRMREIVEQGGGEWSADFHDAEGNVIGASVAVEPGGEERAAESYGKVEGVKSCDLMSVYSYDEGSGAGMQAESGGRGRR